MSDKREKPNVLVLQIIGIVVFVILTVSVFTYVVRVNASFVQHGDIFVIENRIKDIEKELQSLKYRQDGLNTSIDSLLTLIKIEQKAKDNEKKAKELQKATEEKNNSETIDENIYSDPYYENKNR